MEAPETYSDETLKQMLHLAIQEIRCGKTEDAIALLTVCANEASSTVEVWLLLGQAYQQRRDYERAIDAFEIALSLDPLHAFAHYFKAECLFSLKRIAEGLRALQQTQLSAFMLEKPFAYRAQLAFLMETWSNQAAFSRPPEN